MADEAATAATLKVALDLRQEMGTLASQAREAAGRSEAAATTAGAAATGAVAAVASRTTTLETVTVPAVATRTGALETRATAVEARATTLEERADAFEERVDEVEGAFNDAVGDFAAIAALTPVNDDLLQRKAGAWTNRTPAQVKTDLSLAKGDVGLGNVDNTSDANKPVSTATQSALNLKLNASAVSAYGLTLIDDATPGDMQSTLGGTAIGKALFTAADLAAAYSSLSMPLDPSLVANPYMSIWQRGAGPFVPTTSGIYTADALVAISHGDMVAAVTRGEHSAADLGTARSRYFARATVTTAGTGTRFQFARRIEGLDRFAGRTITVQSLVRCSAALNLYPGYIQYGAGPGGSGAPTQTTGTTVALAANTWTLVTRTLTLNSLSGIVFGTGPRLIVLLQLDSPANGTTFDVAMFDVIPGGGAHPNKPRHPATDLVMARRSFIAGACRTENGSRWIAFGAPMRAAPTVTPSAGTAGNITVDGFELSHTSAVDITYTASAEL